MARAKKTYTDMNLLHDILKQYRLRYEYVQKWFHMRIFQGDKTIADYYTKNCKMFIFRSRSWYDLDRKDKLKWQIKFMLLLEKELIEE